MDSAGKDPGRPLVVGQLGQQDKVPSDQQGAGQKVGKALPQGVHKVTGLDRGTHLVLVLVDMGSLSKEVAGHKDRQVAVPMDKMGYTLGSKRGLMGPLVEEDLHRRIHVGFIILVSKR